MVICPSTNWESNHNFPPKIQNFFCFRKGGSFSNLRFPTLGKESIQTTKMEDRDTIVKSKSASVAPTDMLLLSNTSAMRDSRIPFTER